MLSGAKHPGSSPAPDPPTYYSYDALDNLIEVQQQGGSSESSEWRTRTFVYDSLSRLVSATNPEAGTTKYSYDADGNLVSKADARGITTTYKYDADNRLLEKSYSDSEPAVTFSYDQGTNGIGRLTGMTDAAGSESWTYDAMGRVLTDKRTTNGVTKTVTYAYNLDGTLKSLTYPSGRVVSYQVGGAELPLSAADSTTTYASSATYAPQGALATLTLGNSINLTQSYSSRLQPSTIHAEASSGTDLLDLAYDFGLGTADNGDVKAIVNNRDMGRTEYFAYDALNRVTLANTQASSGANAWGQAFGYDPWGNLTNVAVTQGSAPALSISVNANNQIASFKYDAAGDLLADSVNTYTWNAEGKLASVGNASGSTTYSYDGDGRRVMKKTAGKLYWYGTDGQVLSETNLSGNITDEYIFFGGKRIARRDSSGNVDYYLADQLGSARVVTNSSGSILDDCDFLPFGDEECVSSSSGNIYKFTGKERDSESGNDYFGARYYTDTLGRFLSPDPGNAGSDPSNPQSWNGYSYARNDPATVTDPTGLAACFQDSAGGWHGGGDGGGSCWDAGPSGQSSREAANASAAALLGQRARQQIANRKAAVIYGETSGLRPEPGVKGKVNPASAASLGKARQNIADVFTRNGRAYSRAPSAAELKNPQVRAAWQASQAAAAASNGSLPGHNFFIRQAGVGPQRPSRACRVGPGEAHPRVRAVYKRRRRRCAKGTKSVHRHLLKCGPSRSVQFLSLVSLP